MRMADSPGRSGYLAALVFLFLLAGIYHVTEAFMLETDRQRKVMSTVILLAEMLVTYFMLAATYNGSVEGIRRTALTYPFLFIITAVSEYMMYRWKKEHLTDNAVKEAVDRFPVGLCIADAEGVVLLYNLAMHNFAKQYAGIAVRNADVLWEKLCGDRAGSERIVECPDGKTLQMRRTPFVSEGAEYVQITAEDISEEYRLTRELEENNKRLEELKRRLILYSSEVEEITREEEILAAKTSIHNRLGQLLLTTGYDLEHPGELKEDQIYAEWQRIMSLLNSDPVQQSDAFADLIEAGKNIGVRIVIEGELPAEGRAAELIAAGLHESLTNTKKHARGDELRLKIYEEDGHTVAEYRNNGLPPESPVRESGGLGSLRKRAERNGAVMEIVTDPEYVLRLRI